MSQPPIRTCVGCRVTDEKANLQRFVLLDDQLVADPEQNKPGRGSWLHPRGECVEAAVRRAGFSRSHRRRVTVDPEVLTAAVIPVSGLGEQAHIR